MSPREVKFHLPRQKQVRPLRVTDNDTPDVAMLLDTKYNLGISPKVYDMYCNSNKLQCGKPLHLQSIENDSHIYMKFINVVFKVCLVDAYSFVMKQFLEVRRTDRIGDVKAKVIEIINNYSKKDNKANPDNVVLFHQDQQDIDYTELDSETDQLEMYEVKPYDRLVYVWYQSFTNVAPDINYKGQSKRLFGADPKETVISFKLKIQDQFGIPVKAQNLHIPGLKNPAANDKIETFENLSLR